MVIPVNVSRECNLQLEKELPQVCKMYWSFSGKWAFDEDSQVV